MNTREKIVGIPKNTRLKEDVQPILNKALKLEDCNNGIWRSPFLDDTRFVEMKIADLIMALRRRFVDLALISDDKGLEEEAKPKNEERMERCFGLRIEKPPVMRALVREEDKDKMTDRIFGAYYKEPVYSGEKAVTSYPELMRYYVRTKLGKLLQSCNIWKVDGQVESFMRNGVLPNTVLAYDIVRSGDTARKFGLVPVDADQTCDPAYKAYPSFWRNERLLPYQKKYIQKVLPEIMLRLGSEVEIDNRNTREVLTG
ncbi:hypothetical protein ACFL3C_00805 [Patescibacteria group bacterium]